MSQYGVPGWANPEGKTMTMPTISTTTTPMDSAGMATYPTRHEAELFAPLSTLDEPIRETIMRDVRSVASKLKVVVLPMERSVR